MACKLKPGASICAFVVEMKWYFDRLESLNMVFDAELSINIILSGLPADYNQFVLSYQMNRKDTSIMELHSLLQTIKQEIKKIDVPSTSAAPVLTVGHNAKKRKSSHSNWKGKAAQGNNGLKESRRLNHGELNLVLGNRKITHVTRIGDGYKFSFDNENGDILVYSNDCFMFKASPCKGIYEIVECVSNNGNLTPPRTPELNGVAERRNKTLFDMKVPKIPFEMWKGKRPSLGHIKIWGCEVFVRREAQDKLEAISEKCLFREMISKEDSGSKIDLEEIQEYADEEPIVNTDTQQEVVTPDKISDSTLSELDEPANYKEAMTSPEAAKWNEAIKSEIQSMCDNQVWNLVDTTPGLKTVGCKWIFKKKTDMDGKVHTYKARLVAKEDVFMALPEGFKNAKYLKRVCKLQKAIYGLKQTSHSWNLCFHEKVTQFGFSRSEDESCIYVKVSGSVVVFLVLYVDDILLIGNDIPMLQNVKDWLRKCFVMKDFVDATYIFGIKIYKDRSKRLIGLSQDTYLDKILKRFKMENSKKGNVPLHHGIKISKDLCPKIDEELDKMSRVLYASPIGSIMYAMTCTRRDVYFALSMVLSLCDDIKKFKARYSGRLHMRMKNFIGDLRFVPTVQDPIEILCDNKSVVALTKEPKDHEKSKNIERKYHFVRSNVEEGHVIVNDIGSKDNLADLFTMALAKSKQDEHVRSIGLKDKIKF
ncbi:retrotransposon protein, putative, ty1-copia subclass [Tanacetum coccineum]